MGMGQEQENTFKESKELLEWSSVLVHYGEKKELILSCDLLTSSFGVGAVPAQRVIDGDEKPVRLQFPTR